MPRKVTASAGSVSKKPVSVKTKKVLKNLPEISSAPIMPEMSAPVMETAVATETQVGIGLGVLIVSCLTLIAAFGSMAMAGIVGVTSVPATPTQSPKQIVASYSLSGNTNDTISAKNGTPIGGLQCTDLVNGCVFGQPGQYIDIRSVDSLVNPMNGSISADIFPTATGNNRYVVQGIGAGTNRYYIQWTDGNLYVIRGGNEKMGKVLLMANVPLNQWYHVFMVWNYDLVTGIQTLDGYLNGVKKGSAEFIGTGTGGGFKIGTQGTGKEFIGNIKNVKFYNYSADGAMFGIDGTRYGSVAGRIGDFQLNNSNIDNGAGEWGLLTSQAIGGFQCSDKVGVGRGCTFGDAGKYIMISGPGLSGNTDNIPIGPFNPYNGTISAWAYPTGIGENRYIIQGVGAGANRYYIQWHNGSLYAVRGGNEKMGRVLLLANAPLNKWYHVAMTWKYDPLTDTQTLDGYLNGQKINSAPVSYIGEGFINKFTIGWQGNSGKEFIGNVAGVRFYTYALTSAEIAEQASEPYNSNLPKTKPTISAVSLPVNVLSSGLQQEIARFNVAGDVAGDLSWRRINFRYSLNSTSTTLSNCSLRDSNNNNPATAIQMDQSNISIDLAAEQVIAKGAIKTYSLLCDISGLIKFGDILATNIDGDFAASVGAMPYNDLIAAGENRFIWSDMSAASHSLITNDWYGSVNVQVLPSSQWILSK